MEKKIEVLLNNLPKRNILGLYSPDKSQAAQKLLGLIPQSAQVGFSGSQTLEQLGILKQLEARGNKLFNPYKEGLSRQESLEIRRQGAQQADYYLASANAVAESGELVFFSGYGNRTAGIAYAKNVIVVCGENKITPTLAEALKRSREFATPLNVKRLKNWNTACLKDGICRQELCFTPEYMRMCCQVLIIESEAELSRLTLILVGESLGY